MKKTVGLLNLHRAINAGAALQAFSLCSAIRHSGYECNIIDYVPVELNHHKSHQLITARDAMNCVYSVALFRSRSRMLRRFAAFQQKMPIGSPRFTKPSELDGFGAGYDMFVCGSDVVWNPCWIARGIAGPYFLAFAADKPRIAYAPSFGVTEIPTEQQEKIKRLINGFSALSAREKSGVQIIEKLTGRAAAHVLDPTLLVTPEVFHTEAREPDTQEPFMFVYSMQYPRNPQHIEVMRAIARTYHLRPVFGLSGTFHPKWLKEQGDFIFDFGPREFLGLIKKASFVVTNSFHGTALSIVFQKNFVVIPHSYFNTRMESLLETLGLQLRQLNDSNSASMASKYMEPIDYLEVDRLLQAERRKSSEYLRRALEGKTNAQH